MKIRVYRTLISNLPKPLFHFTSSSPATHFSSIPSRRGDRSSEDRFLRGLDFGDDPNEQSLPSPRQSPPTPIPNRPLRGENKPEPRRSSDDLYPDLDDEPIRTRRPPNRPMGGMRRDDGSRDLDDEPIRTRRPSNRPMGGMKRDDGSRDLDDEPIRTRRPSNRPMEGMQRDDGSRDLDDEPRRAPQTPPGRFPDRPIRGMRRGRFDGAEDLYDTVDEPRSRRRPPLRSSTGDREDHFGVTEDLSDSLGEPRSRRRPPLQPPTGRMQREEGSKASNLNGGRTHTGNITQDRVNSGDCNDDIDIFPDLDDAPSETAQAGTSLQNGGPTQRGDRGNQFGASLLQKLKFGKEVGDSGATAPTQIKGVEPAVSEQSMEDADEIFKKMKETGLIPNAVAMLDGLCKDGLVQEAMKLFGLMREKGTIPEVVVYTAVVEGFCKAGKFDDAKRVFRKMQKNGISPNAFSYGLLIQGLCRGKRLGDSLEFCEEMVDARCLPNAATFVGLIQGFCVEKGVEEAASVIRGLQERGFTLDEKAVREHLDKKGPVSPMVHEAIFGKKNSQMPS